MVSFLMLVRPMGLGCPAAHGVLSQLGPSLAFVAEMVWEQVAQFPDCAFGAIGDPRLLGDVAWLAHAQIRGLPFLKVRRSGLGMLYGRAECDGLPVEVGRVSAAPMVARMEFTNDLAELEADANGRWRTLGELRIGGRGAVAVDKQHERREAWRHRLRLQTGWYRGQVFECGDDHLGVRLTTAGDTTG
jgi:hypothetical protein